MKYCLLIVCTLLGSLLLAQEAEEGILLGQWSDTTLEGSNSYNNAYNEVWGYHTEDREYAIIGTTFGTHFIDVTDPTQPEEKFRFAGAVSSPVIVHRDYHDHNGFLYTVPDEGSASTLQIFDLRELPDTVRLVYDEQSVLSRAHNIFIDTSRSLLYTLIGRGGVGDFDPLRIYDISDPLNPVFLKAYSSIEGVGFSQVHDGYIDNDTAFLNLGPFGVMIADFSDIESPKILSYLTTNDYPQAGYNHSGWPTKDMNYYYFADETHGKDLKTAEIRDITNMSVIGTFDAENESPFSIPHNVLVACDKLYVSYYYDGLQVYNIEDPQNPKRLMYYSTSNIAPHNNYEGAWGVYPFLPSGNIIVSDMQEGLFIVEAVNTECNAIVATKTEEISDFIQLYPNPSEGIFRIDLPEIDQEFTIDVYSLDGHIVPVELQKTSAGYSIHTILSAGMYYIHGRNETNFFNRSFIIVNRY